MDYSPFTASNGVDHVSQFHQGRSLQAVLPNPSFSSQEVKSSHFYQSAHADSPPPPRIYNVNTLLSIRVNSSRLPRLVRRRLFYLRILLYAPSLSVSFSKQDGCTRGACHSCNSIFHLYPTNRDVCCDILNTSPLTSVGVNTKCLSLKSLLPGSSSYLLYRRITARALSVLGCARFILCVCFTTLRLFTAAINLIYTLISSSTHMVCEGAFINTPASASTTAGNTSMTASSKCALLNARSICNKADEIVEHIVSHSLDL
jgi:hypothetical protein